MSEPFVGEIRMFAGNYAPRGWAFCNGQLLSVAQNDALFTLLGTIYGGDGESTFGLPDLRGRVPVHAGQGPGLSDRRQGARFGQEQVTLTVNQLPSHGHVLSASGGAATDTRPVGNAPAQAPAADLWSTRSFDTQLGSESVTNVGGSQPHTNLMPYLCVSFIIALFGIYPSA